MAIVFQSPANLTGDQESFLRTRVAVCAMLLLTTLTGCRSSGWIRARTTPHTPLAEQLQLTSWSGPKPTARTLQWLRRYDLVNSLDDDEPKDFIDSVHAIVQKQETAENIYSLSELAFLVAKRVEHEKQIAAAFDFYGIAVANAYLYLLEERLDSTRNPYDPQFRQACDLYNASLEGVLRLVKAEGPLIPGITRKIQTASQEIEMTIVARASWKPDQIERLEFVSDYEPQGLKNRYRTYGLGVPLIAVYRSDRLQPADQFYAPGMSLPTTAFFRVMPGLNSSSSGHSKHVCSLELHDPHVATDLFVENRRVPLETDLSTPLAYSLSDKIFQKTEISTRGLLNPNDSQSVQGLYMLEPYNANKIPVVMVHGLWSSLITWMEMFNDLQGNPSIRNNFQFWFYLYPTGQPFWITAAQMRQDLQKARDVLDPQRRVFALDQMVLVGHSMGGLVARMQTLESGDDYWRLVSERPIDQLQATPEVREQLRTMLFFSPNRSIRRVVTIASPHRGSEFSNETTQWLAGKIIRLPDTFVETTKRLIADNQDSLGNSRLLRIKTSIDSLSPDSPVLPLMLRSPHPPWVQYHNVVGVLPEKNLIGRVVGHGDGVVRFESAHLDNVASEIIVPEDHVDIHRHPRTVLEVQRILLEHLNVARTEYTQLLEQQRLETAVRGDAGQPSGPGNLGPPDRR